MSDMTETFSSVVERLPSKRKALGSVPSPGKKKKKKRKKSFKMSDMTETSAL